MSAFGVSGLVKCRTQLADASALSARRAPPPTAVPYTSWLTPAIFRQMPHQLARVGECPERHDRDHF